MSHQDALDQIEGTTVAFLDFAEALGRALLASERRAFRFLLIGWEAKPVKNAMRGKPTTDLDYYRGLIAQLRELIAPDPAKQLRLRREKPDAVGEMNAGNFSKKTPLFAGVSVRRLNASEATERVAQLSRHAGYIAAIVRELALVRNRDRPEAARMVKLARLMSKLSNAFAERCIAAPGIPVERSLDEIMSDMRALNDLMQGPMK